MHSNSTGLLLNYTDTFLLKQTQYYGPRAPENSQYHKAGEK